MTLSDGPFAQQYCAAVTSAKRRYIGANEFRIVRLAGHGVVGWTFRTGTYPRCNFAWVSLNGQTGGPFELRHAAKKHLCTHQASLRTTRPQRSAP